MDGLSEKIVAIDRIFWLQLASKSYGHKLQLLAELKAKEVYLFRVFLTTTIIR
jgi:hypothetical protein